MMYNDNHPDWIKKYSFRGFCCKWFKEFIMRGLISKGYDPTTEQISFNLNLFDPNHMEEEISVEIKACPFCQKELSKLEFAELKDNAEDNDELDQLIIIPKGFVAQLRFWDRTQKTLTIQINYNDHKAYSLVRAELMEIIRKNHSKTKNVKGQREKQLDENITILTDQRDALISQLNSMKEKGIEEEILNRQKIKNQILCYLRDVKKANNDKISEIIGVELPKTQKILNILESKQGLIQMNNDSTYELV